MASKFRSVIRKILMKPPKESQTKRKYTATDFHEIWCQHRDTKIGKNDEKLVKAVICDVKNKISTNELKAEKIVQDALVFAKESDTQVFHQRNKLILLDVVDILATHKIENRALVRSILSCLFTISRCVDRELIFFDQSDVTHPVKMERTLLNRQKYILEQTAGWVVKGDPWNTVIPCAYLELPFRRAGSPANSNMMAEALYRQQDPDFVLRLLQHGLQPSCLYLWPTCILIDLKFTMLTDQTESTRSLEDILASKEAQMVRYFCRARHYIHVHAVRTEERGESVANLPSGVGYDDILLIPPKAVGIIPEARYRHPSGLQHQCRLRIRRSVYEADCLPRGLNALPLPKPMIQYLHLLMD